MHSEVLRTLFENLESFFIALQSIFFESVINVTFHYDLQITESKPSIKLSCDLFQQIDNLKCCLESFLELLHGLKVQQNHKVTELDISLQNERKPTCKTCRRRFSSKILLDIHQSKVHKLQTYDSQHVMQKDPHLVPFHCCQLCFTTFRSQPDLVSHDCKSLSENNIHPSSDEIIGIGIVDVLMNHNKFFCGYCEEEFRQFNRVSFHLPKCLGRPFVCELCNLECPTKKDLNCHKSTCHRSELSFWCDQCDAKFQRNSSLKKHLIVKHENNRSSSAYQCDRCPKKFIKKIYLTRHKTRFHSLSKDFLCQICGEGFLSKSGLQAHLLLHDGVKRFSCDRCNKKFKRNEKLQAHISTHTGHRPFLCSICLKSFPTKSKLTDHQRRHSGSTRLKFSCLVCNKIYSGSIDLRNHLKTVHPNLTKNVQSEKSSTEQV